MSAFFLSDLHLKSELEPNGQKLLGFLSRLLEKIQNMPPTVGEQNSDLAASEAASTSMASVASAKETVKQGRWLDLENLELLKHQLSDKMFLNRSGSVRLILLGDIFDLWIGDHRYFQERFPKLIHLIQQLVDHKVEVHFFEGNHDLHLHKFWEDKLGVRVHHGPKLFQWSGVQVHLEHGDQMNPDDRGYLFLRWFLRTPVMTWLALNLPGPMVHWIGDQASRSSRDYTSNAKSLRAAEIKLIIHSHVMRLLQNENKFDLFVAGHVHVFEDTYIEEAHVARVINLGSWFNEAKVFYLEA